MPTLTPLRFGYSFGSPELPPEYAYPPLIEVWLGVNFAPPADTDEVSVSDWRRRLGPEWPAIWQAIGPQERHAPGRQEIEKQMTNVMGDRAIRFRRNGFCFGWLGYDGSHYARYETIRDGFVATLDAVQDVMPKLGPPASWTVTYVNRIPQGSVWTTPADWSFFRLWQPNPLKKLKIEPEGFVGQWQYPLDAERGTLSIELTHEPSDALERDQESLWLRFTTTGPTESHESALFDGLDYGREICVRAFNELVTTDAKQFWGERPLHLRK